MTKKKLEWDMLMIFIIGLGLGTLIPEPPRLTVAEKIATWENWGQASNIRDELIIEDAIKKLQKLEKGDITAIYEYGNRCYQKGIKEGQLISHN